jgi:UDP:flavonoid glycosyltransferase YjiC (YdhE family)
LRILALATAGGGGDWPPLAAVISALIERGHQVTCLGDASLVRQVAGTPITVDPVPEGLQLLDYLRGWDEADGDQPLPLGDWTRDVLPWALERARAVRPDVIVSQDFTCGLATALRDALGVPYGLVHGTVYFGRDMSRPQQADYSAAEIERTQRRRAHSLTLAPPDLTLIATDSRFDRPPSPPPPEHHWIGPLLWEPAVPAPAFLTSDGDPWALVSLSTHRQPHEIELARAALDALASFPLRTLLTLPDTTVARDLGTPPRSSQNQARIETFVPHTAVLERAALCVCQAGHGLVAKCMYHGVPMVLVPWGRDQPAVAGRAEALGIARVVRRTELSPHSLADAIRAVLDDESMWARCEEHAKRLRLRDSSAAACELIEALSRRFAAMKGR